MKISRCWQNKRTKKRPKALTLLANGRPRWETLWFIDRTRVEFLIATKWVVVVYGWLVLPREKSLNWSGLVFSVRFPQNAISSSWRHMQMGGGHRVNLCVLSGYFENIVIQASRGAGCFRESQLAAHKNAGWPRSDDGSGVSGMKSSPGKWNHYPGGSPVLRHSIRIQISNCSCICEFPRSLPHRNSILYLTDIHGSQISRDGALDCLC